jgi:hypothetical protein
MIGLDQINANAEHEEKRIAYNTRIMNRHARTVWRMFQDGASVHGLAQMYSVRPAQVEALMRRAIARKGVAS